MKKSSKNLQNCSGLRHQSSQYDLLVLQKIQSSGLDGNGTMPGLCPIYDLEGIYTLCMEPLLIVCFVLGHFVRWISVLALFVICEMTYKGYFCRIFLSEYRLFTKDIDTKYIYH